MTTEVKKKKSGIPLKVAHDIQYRLIAQLDIIYRNVVANKLSRLQKAELIQEAYTGKSYYNKIPDYIHSFVAGYARAREDDLFANHLEWRHSINGKLYTADEKTNIIKNSKETIIIDTNKSCYTHKGFPDKQY